MQTWASTSVCTLVWKLRPSVAHVNWGVMLGVCFFRGNVSLRWDPPSFSDLFLSSNKRKCWYKHTQEVITTQLIDYLLFIININIVLQQVLHDVQYLVKQKQTKKHCLCVWRTHTLPACIGDGVFWQEGEAGESQGEERGIYMIPCSLANAQWEF